MASPLRQELRLALLQCVRRPAFVVGAVLSLAMGMSVATALYSVIDAALRPLPYAHERELVALLETIPEHDLASVPPRLIAAVKADSRTMRDVVVLERVYAPVSFDADAHRVSVIAATANVFATAGVRPVVGAAFEGVDGERTAVISRALWTTEFGGDSAAIGRSIRVGQDTYRIGGVIAIDDNFLGGVDVWLPLSERAIAWAAQPEHDPGWSAYMALARLRPGASREQASAELAMLYRRVYFGDDSRSVRSARVTSLSEFATSSIREQLRLWGAAAFVILLLCAVNFATMSLARGMRRRAELAVRAALGASRAQIVRALMVEALFFAAVAGIVATVMATALLSFVSMLITRGPLAVPAQVGWRTIVFAVCGTMGVGFAFAIAPALELAKVDLRAVMQGGAAGTTSGSSEMRGQRALVALQLCLALTAVAVVTALVGADRRLLRASVPFEYAHLVVTQAQPADSSQRRIAVDPLIARLRELPNVESAGGMGSMVATALLLNHSVEDRPGSALASVSPDFFGTLGVKPIAGRLPTSDEITTGAPLVVISRFTAEWAFGSDSASIGQRVRMKTPGREAETATVIGVVPDLQAAGLYAFGASIYRVRPLRDERGGVLVMRLRGPTVSRVREIAKAAADFDSRISISGTASAQEIVDRTIGASRGRTIFLTVVGALALALAVIGVYGLASYTTELRARELAIRVALGAHTGNLFRVIGAELWWMAALSVLVAACSSAWLVRFLDTLYRPAQMHSALVTLPVGPLTASAVTLVVILALGVTMPVRRVLRVDVMRAVQGG